MNCNTTHYRANSSSVPGDPTDLYVMHNDAQNGWVVSVSQPTGTVSCSMTNEEATAVALMILNTIHGTD